MTTNGEIKDIDYDKAQYNYVYAINHGLLKILSKMGISTIRSYHGAQIFEAIGLSSEFVNKYFVGTASRIEGIGVKEVAEEVLIRHKNAFNKIRKTISELEVGGQYSWRKNGEFQFIQS